MAHVHTVLVLTIRQHQTLVCQYVHEPWHAPTEAGDFLRRIGLKHLDIGCFAECRRGQAMRQIARHPMRHHRPEVFAEGDALQQLTNFGAGQLLVKFGLPQQNQLQQLSLFRLQIRQQAKALHRTHRNRLRLINAHHHALPRLGVPQQTVTQRIEYFVAAQGQCDVNTQFSDQGHQQIIRTHIRIGYIGRDALALQGLEQLTA